MSSFTRFLHPIPTPRRTYSSFFSSKSGRYFNSAKPPKSVVAPNSGVKSSNVEPATPTSANDGGNATRSRGSSGNGPNQILKANVDEPRPAHPQSTSSASSKPMPPTRDNSHPPNHVAPSPSHASWQHSSLPSHTIVNPKEFRLHQFFSLHRPLLLLSHPSSILQPAPSTGPLYSTPLKTDANTDVHSPLPFDALEDNPEASTIDADAEAARQLTRALTLSRAGGAIAWESTLRRLGIDVDLDEERVGLQQQMDREWQEVMMDSTRRKRKKKMKKHKLKKRRKATRATRLKIGR